MWRCAVWYKVSSLVPDRWLYIAAYAYAYRHSARTGINTISQTFSKRHTYNSCNYSSIHLLTPSHETTGISSVRFVECGAAGYLGSRKCKPIASLLLVCWLKTFDRLSSSWSPDRFGACTFTPYRGILVRRSQLYLMCGGRIIRRYPCELDCLHAYTSGVTFAGIVSLPVC